MSAPQHTPGPRLILPPPDPRRVKVLFTPTQEQIRMLLTLP